MLSGHTTAGGFEPPEQFPVQLLSGEPQSANSATLPYQTRKAGATRISSEIPINICDRTRTCSLRFRRPLHSSIMLRRYSIPGATRTPIIWFVARRSLLWPTGTYKSRTIRTLIVRFWRPTGYHYPSDLCIVLSGTTCGGFLRTFTGGIGIEPISQESESCAFTVMQTAYNNSPLQISRYRPRASHSSDQLLHNLPIYV